MHYLVYKTTNLMNNKIYIGLHRTENINDSYLGSGFILNKAIKKYGRNNFKKEVLFDFNNIQQMIDKEIELVNEEFIERTDTYNLITGGQQAGLANYWKGKKHTEEYKRKMSEACKGQKNSPETIAKRSGKNHCLYGKHRTEEVKEKIRVALTGRKLTEEHKKAISRSGKGRIVTKETRKKISEANKKYFSDPKIRKEMSERQIGRHLSEETKKRISKSRKGKLVGRDHPFYGKHHTEESRRKMSEKSRGRIPWNKGKIGVYSEEALKKMSEARLGKKAGMLGKKHLEESKRKMSKAQLGKTLSKEHKKNISESLRKLNKTRIGHHPNFGKKWIYNEKLKKNKTVKEPQEWLDNGWKLGFRSFKEK